MQVNTPNGAGVSPGQTLRCAQGDLRGEGVLRVPTSIRYRLSVKSPIEVMLSSAKHLSRSFLFRVTQTPSPSAKPPLVGTAYRPTPASPVAHDALSSIRMHGPLAAGVLQRNEAP